MLILGLTGGSGCGKGTVGALLSEHGAAHIDTDKVYHTLTDAPSPCTEALRRAFGDAILTKCGALDRKRLREVVFAKGQEAALATLNGITHPFVLEECKKWLAEQERAGTWLAVIDAPLLFEAGFDAACDRTLAVLAARQVRLARIMIRDGISLETAEKRLNAQPQDSFYLAHANDILYNSGTIEELSQKVTDYAADLRCVTK